jgi:gamma-glutamylcyclotransferase (GGCT)/AIG2-like uncharacterized protein YtfP
MLEENTLEKQEKEDSVNMLFVYGTLRRNNINNHILISHGAIYRSEYKTHDKYKMYSTNSYPYILPDNSGTYIIGDVYCVSDKLIELLDGLEGHPHQYTRTTINIIDGDNIFTVYAYICINPSLQSEIMDSPRFFEITSGDWNTRCKN